MKHIVYQITNTINGKIYIGKHSTKTINDAYIGSGVAIRRAIKKYGVNHFTKEILFVYDEESLAHLKETEIVNEAFVQRSDTYNMTIGGKGGFPHIDNYGENNPMKRDDVRAKFIGNNNPAKRSEVRAKISKAVSGKNNAMYGKCGSLSPRYGIPRDDMRGNLNPAKTSEARAKISEFASSRKGESSPRFIGWYTTPAGKFASKADAATGNNISLYRLNKKINDTGNLDWLFIPK